MYEIVGSHRLDLSLPPRQLLRVVSFRLSRRRSQPIPARDLANILHSARIQQIGEVNHEVSLFYSHLNQRRLSVLTDFDAGTTRKCGRASSTAWDGDDRASERVRAAHRVMREHAPGQDDSSLSLDSLNRSCCHTSRCKQSKDNRHHK